MGDYSPHVLDRARKAVAHHARAGQRAGAGRDPADRHPRLPAHKAFLVYISNVYDNLPTDEVARIGGRTYLVETRPTCAEDDADQIAGQLGCRRDELAPLIERLLRLGPELLAESAPDKFADTGQAVAFWQAALGGAAPGGALRAAGGPGHLPDHARR